MINRCIFIIKIHRMDVEQGLVLLVNSCRALRNIRLGFATTTGKSVQFMAHRERSDRASLRYA